MDYASETSDPGHVPVDAGQSIHGNDRGNRVAYRLSVDNVYSETIDQHVIDDPRAQPLSEMEFEDPREVDGIASNPQSRGIFMLHGYRVKPDSAPKKFLWDGKGRLMPEILQWQGVMIVDDRFRLLVEEFEPGIHQFIPVEVYTSQGGEAAATYYWFNVCSRLDTVDPDRTTFVQKPSHGGSWYWSDRIFEGGTFKKIDGARIVFDDNLIGDNDLWVEPSIMVARDYNCSDAFGDAALAAEFTGLVVTPRSSLYICRAA